MTLRVGVLGLGRMGAPIARRLGEVFEVAGFDPAHPSAAGAVEAAGSAAEVAARSDVLLTILPGAAEACALTFDSLPAGALWLDLTSNDPRVTATLADAAAASGVRAAAAPMAGGPDAAGSGELRFFVGAAPGDRELVQRVLAPLGTPFPELLERPEQAQLAKLLANGLWFGQVVAVTEALLLGRASGIDPQTLRSLLAGSAAGSRFLDDYAGRMIAGDTLPAFGIDRVVEELDALQGLAGEAGVPHRILSVVAELHRETLAAYGPVDGELLAARHLGLP